MLQKLSFFFVLFVIRSTAASSAGCAPEWDYHSALDGVNTWSTHFPTCGGKRQSPIHINTNNRINSNLGDIKFTNYGTIPSNVKITAKNNGHSYSVSFSGFTDYTIPKISGGGLPGVFKLDSFHFHWGSDDRQGSEHRFNNLAYPAELHLVHYNTKYSNVSEAVKHSDGLAVLGVLLAKGHYNYNYNFLESAAQQVTYPGMTTKITISSLMSLLPKYASFSFYRYSGSLTTPECNQVVTWTLFNHLNVISQRQLNALRGLKYRDPTYNHEFRPLVNNYRPTQALYGRRVFANSNGRGYKK